MKEFFEAVYGSGEGRACITLCNDDMEPVIDKFFEYPAQLDRMVRYCEAHADEDVYFTPTLWNANRRRKPVAKWLSVAFGDADTFDVAQARIEPSIIVRTSPTKTHLYWILENEHDPIEVEAINHGISDAHPKDTTGFDDGWNMTKILRVPGTSNLKYAEPFTVQCAWTGAVYTSAEMELAYPKVREGQVVFREQGELPTYMAAMDSITYTSTIGDILDQKFQRGSRSEALHFAIHELFRAGATDEATFVILQGSRLNKWADEGLQDADQRLWEDILRARAKSEIVVDEDAAPIVLVDPDSKHRVVDFLSKDERATLPRTFVDDFVDWSSSKTKSPKDFQVASAFTVLSTVFGDFGHLPMNWGNVNLALWFMVAGRTTLDRKTTTKSHMLAVLDALGDDDYDYDLGSDFTIQALGTKMLEKPNRSGAVTRDEFQGFLAEMAKSYMSGTKDALTDWYSGRVSSKIRATGEKKKYKAVNFSLAFYAMGIKNQIAEALTSEDFRSGFLTRFIWAIPAEGEDADFDFNDGFELAPETGGGKMDMRFIQLVNQLQEARDYFYAFADGLDSPTQVIRPSAEALERIKELRTTMYDATIRSGKQELVASADRLSQSILKCAALLAMSQRKDVVELEHVLCAVAYSGPWFTNMLHMVDLVAESDWAKDQQEVLNVLMENDSQMGAQQLYAKFRSKHKPREYAEIMRSLEDSGRIQLVRIEKKDFVNYIGGDDD